MGGTYQMREETQSDSYGFPSHIFGVISILSLMGIIFHSCAAVYMVRNFNLSKPIYKLMLSSCIIALVGLVSEFITSTILSKINNEILCMLFEISIVSMFITQVLLLQMSILRHGLLQTWMEKLQTFYYKLQIWESKIHV